MRASFENNVSRDLLPSLDVYVPDVSVHGSGVQHNFGVVERTAMSSLRFFTGHNADEATQFPATEICNGLVSEEAYAPGAR